MTQIERVRNESSLHDAEDKTKCPDGFHAQPWRTLLCDGEIDTVECSRCGHQRRLRCNFDGDYS